jgi:hypothetical protein
LLDLVDFCAVVFGVDDGVIRHTLTFINGEFSVLNFECG